MKANPVNPPIWLETPKGVGIAIFCWWPGLECSLYWTVAIVEGEFEDQIWTFENEKVRLCKNITLGRMKDGQH